MEKRTEEEKKIRRRERDRARYAANRELACARSRSYKETHREQERETARKRYAADPEKSKAALKDWRDNHVEQQKQYRRTLRYGISSEAQEQLLQEQRGVCAICGLDKPLGIDHDHDTGIVRGWLCYSCNTILGHAADDPERLRKAAQYLEEKANGDR
jgi:hypothetical protein